MVSEAIWDSRSFLHITLNSTHIFQSMICHECQISNITDSSRQLLRRGPEKRIQRKRVTWERHRRQTSEQEPRDSWNDALHIIAEIWQIEARISVQRAYMIGPHLDSIELMQDELEHPSSLNLAGFSDQAHQKNRTIYEKIQRESQANCTKWNYM